MSQKKQYRVEAWPRQVDIFGRFKPEQYNPQYYDARKHKWRPYTVTKDGKMGPRLYDSREEANQYIEIMKIKDDRGIKTPKAAEN